MHALGPIQNIWTVQSVKAQIYGGVRHGGCKGLNPLGLTRGMRASLMHEGFPHSLFNVVCSGTPALTGKLMHRCTSSGSTEKMGSGMMGAAPMHVCMHMYLHRTCKLHCFLKP